MRRPVLLIAALSAALLTVHHGVADDQGDKAGEPDRAAMRARMLKRLDTDGDGRLSHEERTKGRADFARKRGGPDEQASYRSEVVTFPEDVTAADPNLNKEALLYSPIKGPEGKIPLVVLLHGAGGTKKKDISTFKGNRDVKWVMTPDNSKYAARILVPHVRGHWNPNALNKVVDHLLGTHDDIDEDRIYCVGYSLGGLGTWNWARHSPERLAAVVPVAFIANQDDLKRMVNLPIWAMAGTGDRRRVGSIRSMDEALKELGSTAVRTTIFEGANHAQTAGKAWAQQGLLDWLFAQSRRR